jgi:hypothetical protein
MGMQGLELVGVAALLVIGFLLFRPWARHLRRANPGMFWAVTIVGVAVIGGTLALIFQGDFFPDRLEPVGRIALLIGVVGGGLLLSLREAT